MASTAPNACKIYEFPDKGIARTCCFMFFLLGKLFLHQRYTRESACKLQTTHPATATGALIPDLSNGRTAGPSRTCIETVWNILGFITLNWQHFPSFQNSHLMLDHAQWHTLETLIDSSFPGCLHGVDLVYCFLLIEKLFFSIGTCQKGNHQSHYQLHGANYEMDGFNLLMKCQNQLSREYVPNFLCACTKSIRSYACALVKEHKFN